MSQPSKRLLRVITACTFHIASYYSSSSFHTFCLGFVQRLDYGQPKLILLYEGEMTNRERERRPADRRQCKCK
jgi:hypothetical protein